ncbi:Pre-mRNA splicing Prp18-interacting factor-domain-containing protein [Phakopsora pachyrhizi]|nr:Pre-mRNA splicing Prp18-interacting factor-domain-containing protein [Phakopsora pachyrhizi]
MATASASAIGKISREEFRRQKDLDAARKAGNAPAEVDEDGNAINPHIPQFMAQAPWYMNTGAPSLKHQKGKEYNADPSKLKEQVARGFKIYSATKYRKGACTNCGAMSHKVIDCLERPRKKGAKWTNQDIAPDEFNAGKKPEDWDGKRDRWDGYDPSEHKKVVEEHQALEQARQKMREEQLDKSTDLKEVKRVARAGKMAKKKTAEEDEFGSSDESDDEDEDKYADAADQAGQKMDTKTRMTVRNLRIREDTAKYLMNLDTESAYYDPKTRSMREAPQKDVPLEDAKFAGDNFQRASAGASDVQKLQLFAWQSEQRGNDVHINANPTQGELLHKEFLKKKEKLKETSKVGILDRYGGEEHLERVPVELMVGQTENYVEYSRTGSVIKGQERAKAKSKYDEDAGIEAESREQDLEVDLSSKAQSVNSSNNKSLIEEMEENIRRKAAEVANFGRGGKKRVHGDGDDGDGDDSGRKEREERLESKKRISDLGEVGKLDRNKLKKAIKDERRRKLMDADQAYDAQKNDDSELTEEQLEAYRLCKDLGHEDPMNDIKGDELLPL